MRSYEKRRQQKTSQEGSLREEAVNPCGTGGAPSFSSAQTEERACEVPSNDLLEQVLARANMDRALRRVEQNKGAAGIDGMAVKSLRPYLRENWPRIREQLLNGTYQPCPVRRVEIPKPDGGVRLLGIPTVVDRLIQQALLQAMTPIFDPHFSDHSYGFRPGRSAHQAVKKARGYIVEGNRFVVDMDLEKFFDRVNHDVLTARVARKVKDKRVLKLVRGYLEAGIMLNGVAVASEEGTPQGGPLSPLLANIILDDLDKELEKRGHQFVRYADDCNIYVRSRRAGQRVMESVSKLLEGRLKLKVNRAKSAVDRPWKRKFLGFSFTAQKKTRIRLAEKSVKRFKERIRELTQRSRSMNIRERINRLNVYLRGWFGYFRLTETPSILQEMDEWLRRRLRMCLLKQWKNPRTRLKNLVALGIPRDWARWISGSRKGYWRLSKTPQMNKALGIAYWQDQGLMSLSDCYKGLC